jgi:hypothetical protein
MTNDLPPSSQKKPEDETQGQKMTIYMPPGAVIVEQSDMDPPTAVPATQNQTEEPQVSSKVGNESVQSLGAVINIYTSDEARGIKQHSHSELPTIENALVKEQQVNAQQVNEQDVLLRISQTLDLISRRLNHDGPPAPAFIRSTMPEEVIEKKPAIVLEERRVEEKYVGIGFHFDWMHAFNIIYISLILFSILLPAGLSTIFKMEVIAATTSYEVAGIQRGDLLITAHVPASALVVNDFVSMYDAFSSSSEMIQVSEVSAPGVNGEVTITVPPQAGQALSASYTVDGNIGVDRVEKSVPKLGYVNIIFGSFFVQFFVAAFVIILNAIVHTRRHRRYSRSLRRYAYQ